jgi:chemotaxis protein MotB
MRQFGSRKFYADNSANNPVHHVWPGFVDALSALLTVVLFAFMIFVVSYVCTRSIIQRKDSSLSLLQKKTHALGKQLVQKNQMLDYLKRELEKRIALCDTTQARLLKTEAALQAEQNIHRSDQKSILALSESINQKILELSGLSQKLQGLQTDLLKANQPDARSAFFGELKKALKDRKEIRIVGDRFIFSSEILFDLGSAIINDKGKKELSELSLALTDIMHGIPENVSWVLRVDGHTDTTPIRGDGRFKSNLELSTARATAVVDFLVSQGFPAQRLAAAGFAEFRPLVPGNPSAKDRRIELMFDQGY